MIRYATLLLGMLSLTGLTAAVLAQVAPAPTKPTSPLVRNTQAAEHGETPERVFETNCGRCHYAPESLSPRITGTVVRHMRVRANLSAEQERMILSYLNP